MKRDHSIKMENHVHPVGSLPCFCFLTFLTVQLASLTYLTSTFALTGAIFPCLPWLRLDYRQRYLWDVGMNYLSMSDPRMCILVHCLLQPKINWLVARNVCCYFTSLSYESYGVCRSPVTLLVSVVGSAQFSCPDPSLAWLCLMSPVLSNGSSDWIPQHTHTMDVSDPHSFGCLRT